MIYTGTNEPKKIYVGTSEVKKIYLGTSFIWENFDSDALAYVTLVEEELQSSIIESRKQALNLFFKALKKEGFDAFIKRMFLPIWSNEQANRIELFGLTKGNFIGGVRHRHGYISSNGVDGYFDSLLVPTNDGVSLDSGSIFAFFYGSAFQASQPSNNGPKYGGRPGNTNGWLVTSTSSVGVFSRLASGGTDNAVKDSILGIHLGNRIISTATELHSISQQGEESLNNFNRSSSILPTSKMFALALSLNNTPGFFSTPEHLMGMFGHGLGVPTHKAPELLSMLKTLWESCMGASIEIDPDALHYIASVENELSYEITSFQKNAIDSFYKNEKASGRYSLLRRMYLPIWGNENANRICMISGNKGNYLGGIVHGDGWVEGDGISGCFELDVNMPSLGMSSGSSSVFFIRYTVSTIADRIFGTLSGARAYLVSRGNTNWIGGEWVNASPQGAWSSSGPPIGGVGIFSRFEGVSHLINRTLDNLYVGGITYADQGVLPNSIPQFMSLAGNNIFSNGKFGAMGVGVGMSAQNATELTLNLKTLWEDCTNLTLLQ